MKTQITITTALLFFINLYSSLSFAETFVDKFDSGDLSGTNQDGFRWSSTNRTAIVSATQELFAGNRSVLRSKSEASVFPGGNWSPLRSTNSLRFSYAVGSAMSEQRFNLGVKAYRELWVKYWLRVPTNFKHGSKSPSNNKLLSIWMDGYSSKGDGPTVIWEFWNDRTNGSQLAVHWSEGQFKAAGGHKQRTAFISYPQDQGRWMEVLFHVVAATNRSSNDGIVEMWRRWDGEKDYTKFHNVTDANIAVPPNGPQGWNNGYMMGWSNPGYDNNTEWLVNEFTILDNSTVVRPTETNPVIIPKAPTLFTPQ